MMSHGLPLFTLSSIQLQRDLGGVGMAPSSRRISRLTTSLVVAIREDALILNLEIAAAQCVARSCLQARWLLPIIVGTGAR